MRFKRVDRADDEAESDFVDAGLDERTLIEAAKAGKRPAFDELVRRTYAETYALAFRLTRSAEDAADVSQETYLRAYKGLKGFRGEAQFSTWLYRITANCSATALGRRQRHTHSELVDAGQLEDESPDGDPVLQAEGSALRGRIDRALAELPPKLRAVVVLRDVYDLGHEAIAQQLDISETAAKVRLHRARRRLKEVLSDQDLPLADTDSAAGSDNVGALADAV